MSNPVSNTMTLARALKVKNRRVERIGWLKAEIARLNSVEAGTLRDYDVAVLYGELISQQAALCVLKDAVASANEPVQRVIYQLSELKDRAVFLRQLSTKHGSHRSREGWGSGDAVVVEYDAVMGKKAVDDLLKSIKHQIDELQERLDAHNNQVTVCVPDFVD